MVGNHKGPLKYSWTGFRAPHGKQSWSMSCLDRERGLVWLLAWVTCSLLVSNRHPRTPCLGKVSGVGSLHMKKVVPWTWHSVFSVSPIAFRHWAVLSPMLSNCPILTLKSYCSHSHKGRPMTPPHAVLIHWQLSSWQQNATFIKLCKSLLLSVASWTSREWIFTARTRLWEKFFCC